MTLNKAEEGKEFPECPDVLEYYYCVKTGKLASAKCPTGSVGYYKQSNIPEMCSGVHKSDKEDEEKKKTNED